jgi:hypothetical protein
VGDGRGFGVREFGLGDGGGFGLGDRIGSGVGYGMGEVLGWRRSGLWSEGIRAGGWVGFRLGDGKNLPGEMREFGN